MNQLTTLYYYLKQLAESVVFFVMSLILATDELSSMFSSLNKSILKLPIKIFTSITHCFFR